MMPHGVGHLLEENADQSDFVSSRDTVFPTSLLCLSLLTGTVLLYTPDANNNENIQRT